MGPGSIVREILSEFHPRYLLPSIAAAVVVAAIEIVLAISFGALIFTGPLQDNLSVGISVMLLSTTIYALLFALFSKLKGMIGGLQDTAIAILAILAMSVTASATIGSSNELLLTIAAMIALTSILSGIILIVIGGLKLGRLVRYVPYPVIGGFLAGAGWLLVIGSISMLTDQPVSLGTLSSLITSEQLLKWVPGAVFGILVYLITRKYDHYLIIPGMILGAIAIFYLVNGFGASNMQIAAERGYLFAPIGSTSFFQPIFFYELVQSDFGIIADNLASLLGVVIIGVITILLSITGIEIALQRDLDLNYELRLAGFANLLTGLGGGVAGCHILSDTALIYKIRASTRLTGIFFALITAAVMFFGASIITLIPKFVLGGLLLFIGLSFLVEWLVDSFQKFSRAEYMIIVLIVGFIATIGFLEGVGIGVFLSVVYFVVRYSKIAIIHNEIPGPQLRSTVQRPNEHWEGLKNADDQAIILKLQGFLFFGTANNLLEHAREIIATNVKYLILDFQRVTGFDSSAALSFIKLMQVAAEKERMIVFCSIDESTQKAFFHSGFYFQRYPYLRVFNDLDHSLEWYEESVLDEIGFLQEDTQEPLMETLANFGIQSSDVDILIKYADTCTVGKRETLIKQGDTSRDLYYVETGQLTVELETGDGSIIRVSTLNPGVFFGEMSYYLKQVRSANIVADERSELLRFSEESLARLEEEHPAIGVVFHTLLATTLSARLRHTDDTLRSVLM